MNRDQKAAEIEKISADIADSGAVFAVDYRGITVAQVADLRSKLRESQATLRVVKNTLSVRAAEQAGAGALTPLFSGPTALALVKGDASVAAKAINDTARALNGPLQFKGGFMNGKLLSVDEVTSIAKLPSRETLVAQLVGTVAAPISGIVRGLNALIAGLAIQLGAIAEQGLVGGAAAVTESTGASVDGPSDE
jgi:large subunit ribosomal protein L10